MNYRLTVSPPFEISEGRKVWEIRLYCQHGVHWLIQVPAGAPENAPGLVLYSSRDDSALIEEMTYFGMTNLHPGPQLTFEQMVKQGKAERFTASVQGPSSCVPQQLVAGYGSRVLFAWSPVERDLPPELPQSAELVIGHNQSSSN